MSFGELQSLLILTGEPVLTGTPDEWKALSQRLGHRLPVDYCQFVSTYGHCTIDFHFSVLNPFADNGGFWSHLDTACACDREDYQMSRPDDPLDDFPRPKGLIPWGSTDDGGEAFWVADSGDPDGWTVYEEWELAGDFFHGGMEQFLIASLRGQKGGLSLGSGFPSRLPAYADPVVAKVSVSLQFQPSRTYEQTAEAAWGAFPEAWGSREGNELVTHRGGWWITWRESSFQVTAPPHELAAAKDAARTLAAALGVRVTSVSEPSWSDLIR